MKPDALQPLLLKSWQTALGQGPAPQRVKALLAHPRPSQLVHKIPAQDLYMLIAEVGLADASELIAISSPEQFRSFVDLDIWRGDRCRIDAILPWVRALTDGGCPDVARQLRGLDVELFTLLIRSLIIVTELEENEPAPPPKGVFVTDTPDNRYRVEAVSEDNLDVVRLLISTLVVDRGPLGLGTFLSTIQTELDAQLEERTRHWRSGRMADLGFPSQEEAAELEVPYRSAEHARNLAQGPGAFYVDSDLPRYLVERAPEKLLRQAIEAIDDPTLRARVAQDFVYLCNAVMVRADTAPGDPKAVKAQLERVEAHLSLALRWLGGADVASATLVLRRTPARVLYRTAITLLTPLIRRAQSLQPLAHRLDPQAESLIAGLGASSPSDAEGTALVDPHQLTSLEIQLTQLEWAARWLENHPGSEDAVQLFGTWLVNMALGKEPLNAPLSSSELQSFLRHQLVEGRLRDELISQAQAHFPEEAAQAQIQRWCEGLTREWGHLDPSEPLDPRFIGGALLLETESEQDA